MGTRDTQALPDLDPARKSALWRMVARNRAVRVARAARHVRRPLAFARAELRTRDGAPRRWEVRGGRSPVVLRSGTPDFDIFEEIFRARTYEPPAEVREVLNAVGRPLVVADLGANVGLFTAWIVGEFAIGRVRLFEPDPVNLAVLRQTLDAATETPHELYEGGAGVAPGRMGFHSGGFQMSRRVSDQEAAEADVVEVPVFDALPALADADLLKLDIEGAEWPILADQRLAASSLRAIVVEYHRADGCPEGHLPDVATERLRAAGFEVRHLFWNPPWVGQLWAWRHDVADAAAR